MLAINLKHLRIIICLKYISTAVYWNHALPFGRYVQTLTIKIQVEYGHLFLKIMDPGLFVSKGLIFQHIAGQEHLSSSFESVVISDKKNWTRVI